LNIDERLEALAQSMELLTLMHKDTEKMMNRLGKRNARLETLVTEIAEGTARLVHVAEAHEHRVSRLEGESSTL
jgi:hypothetical protein